NTHIYKSWNKGIRLAQEKIPNTHVLVINDDLLISQSLISTFKHVSSTNKGLAYVPETVSRAHVSRQNRGVFKAMPSSKIELKKTDWMVGFCYLLTRVCIEKVGYFNEEKFEIWFGDTDYEDRIKKQGDIIQ